MGSTPTFGTSTYIDPPVDSGRSYSVIFKDESGRGSDAQGGLR